MNQQTITIDGSDLIVSIQTRQQEIQQELLPKRALLYEVIEQEKALVAEYEALDRTIRRAASAKQKQDEVILEKTLAAEEKAET